MKQATCSGNNNLPHIHQNNNTNMITKPNNLTAPAYIMTSFPNQGAIFEIYMTHE